MKHAISFSKIGHRFILHIIPISLGTIFLLGFYSYYQAKRLVLSNIHGELSTLGSEAANSINSFLERNSSDIATIADTPLFHDYYVNVDYGLTEEAEQYRKEISFYFQRFANRHKDIVDLRFIDARGRRICSLIDAETQEVDAELVRLFKSDRGIQFLQRIDTGKETAGLLLSAKPIIAPDHSFKGVIVLKTNLSLVFTTLESLKLGKSGSVYFGQKNTRPILVSGQKPFIDSVKSPKIVETYRVGNSNYELVISANPDDFLVPLFKIRHYTVLVAMICAVLVALAIYLAVRKITQPLYELEAGASALAIRGEHIPVKFITNDEIGSLAMTFNDMGSKLVMRTRELEARINELMSLQLMGAAFMHDQNANEVCRIGIEMAVKGIGFERGIVYLISDDGTTLESKYTVTKEGVNISVSSKYAAAIKTDGDSTFARAIRTRETLNITSLANASVEDRDFIAWTGTKAFCVTPLMTNKRVYGVMAVDNFYTGRIIESRQAASLAMFCNSTALALENSELVENIRHSEAKYRLIVNSTSEAIISLSVDLKIIVWNHGAEAIFDMPAENAIGQFFGIFFDSRTLMAINNDLLTKNRFESRSINAISKTGRNLKLDMQWAAALKTEAEPKEWVVVIRDITELSKLQSHLIQSEKMAAVGQLMASITHELNNPLTVIVGCSELIKKSAADTNILPPEEINAIYHSAQRCEAIVDNFLAFVRTTSHYQTIVNVKETLSAVVDLFRYKFKTSSILVHQDVPSDLPYVLGNFQQIEQVLVNLIQNAIDSLVHQEGRRLLRIAISIKGDSLLLSITDNGIGIPSEILPEIFEPFFTTKKEGEGTGLGLAICKQIIDAHNGNMRVESTPFKETVFSIELPIVKLAPKNEQPLPEVPLLSRRSRLLVIDDEKRVLGLIKKILEDAGQSVETANDGIEALPRIAQGKYDVILCDIEMEPLDGYDIYERVQKMEAKPKFIFMTGRILSNSAKSRIANWGVFCINKPFSIKELVAAIARTEK